MAKRTGVPTLQNLAQKMCKVIVAFAPIINRVYPDRPALQLALTSALTACDVLYKELEEVREYGD